ncbi:MAG TPA: DUF2950 domain-containing protein [Deltaproteobacteria bacterium]|nr:DUF2950 domain-containing protein [Deltaproteobacteria bacterium]
MIRVMNRIRLLSMVRSGIALGAALLFAMLLLGTETFAAAGKSVKQLTFTSPEEAVRVLADGAMAKDTKAMFALFGSDAKGVIISDDQAADKDLFDRFVAAYKEKNRIDTSTDNTVFLYVGNNEWPFPIPMVKKGQRWVFDTKAGKAEILHRRIGRNELGTVQACLAYVDAQKDYARMVGQKDGLTEYARKFVSDPGTRNGLYWETKDGEEPSPLGIFMARARKEGYAPKQAGGKPVPYHGYFYRILGAQGKNAPGGAYDYVVKDRMIGGFALVAYPAQYGVTGVMTFIVNQDGVVYEKNMGRNTAKTANVMKTFDPDDSWKKVQ